MIPSNVCLFLEQVIQKSGNKLRWMVVLSEQIYAFILKKGRKCVSQCKPVSRNVWSSGNEVTRVRRTAWQEIFMVDVKCHLSCIFYLLNPLLISVPSASGCAMTLWLYICDLYIQWLFPHALLDWPHSDFCFLFGWSCHLQDAEVTAPLPRHT